MEIDFGGNWHGRDGDRGQSKCFDSLSRSRRAYLTVTTDAKTLTITFKTVTTQGGTTMDSVTVDRQPGKIAWGIEFSL